MAIVDTFYSHMSGLFVGIVASLIASFVFIWLQSRKRIGYIFPKIGSTPSRFNLKDFAFLDKLKGGDSVIVYARTALRWAKEQEKITSALQRGVKIVFYISSRKAIRETGETDLMEDLDRSMSAFKNITSRVNGKLEVYVVEEVITNSVTIVKRRNKEYAVIELTQARSIDKKIVAIVKNKAAVDILKIQYSKLKHYPLEIMELMDDYEKVILTHRDLSPKQELENIVSHRIDSDKLLPSIIQISLTNKCPSGCAMCTHNGIARKYEMTEVDIKRVTSQAKKLGVESLIFSGGEPLMRDKGELIRILSNSVDKKFYVGLMTSGFTGKNQSIDDDIAASIQSGCNWVQFSVDSFKKEVYENIRNRSFDAAIESLKQLYKRIPNKLEICFTMQKNNYLGLVDGSELKACKELEEKIGGKLNVRLKFAHGDPGSEYLLDEDEIRNILRKDTLTPWGRNYFEQTMGSKIFSRQDIANGQPVKSFVLSLKKKNYCCYALNENLYIDANGDVYPCCHLFDDNVSNSKFRTDYYLDSLIDKQAGVVTESSNKLEEIWKGDKLIELRKLTLPVHESACYRCIRYVNYNVFSNGILNVLDRNQNLDLSQFVD